MLQGRSIAIPGEGVCEKLLAERAGCWFSDASMTSDASLTRAAYSSWARASGETGEVMLPAENCRADESWRGVVLRSLLVGAVDSPGGTK